jgi:hypothetical protein
MTATGTPDTAPSSDHRLVEGPGSPQVASAVVDGADLDTSRRRRRALRILLAARRRDDGGGAHSESS